MTLRLTRLQRVALAAVYHRAVKAYAMGPERLGTHYMNYRAFRRTVQPGPGCIMVQFAGMWLGIEPDGYTHS
jgi:hypothetical protein